MKDRSRSKSGADPDAGRIEDLYRELHQQAEDSGYHLNPDREFTEELLRSLIINRGRYGYMACPCRLADGNRERDLDIICPCDYRDPDLFDFGTCYCALYVSTEIAEGKGEAGPIPERRPPVEERGREADSGTRGQGDTKKGLPYPVYRCTVCGYLCARQEPPGSCPICKADRDRFERFM